MSLFEKIYSWLGGFFVLFFFETGSGRAPGATGSFVVFCLFRNRPTIPPIDSERVSLSNIVRN